MQIEKNLNCQARLRLAMLFDDGSYTEINSSAKENDSLTGVVTAYGFVNGNPVYAFSQDKEINAGAVGKAHAAKIAKIYSLAAKTGAPVVGIHDSNGAFVEGMADTLSAYGQMIMAASNVSGVVPQISVIAGTCAGSAAMLACAADIVVMSREGELFMTPPFDAEKNGRGSADACAKAGTASLVCDDDKSAIAKTREILNLLPVNNLSALPVFEYEAADCAISNSAEGIVNAVCDKDSAIELSADFGKSAFTALATVDGQTVGTIATNKSDSTLSADDCAKIARFVRMCDAFAIPVITFIDTLGFERCADAELAGAIRSMTALAGSYAEATTIKIAVVTGNAIGAAFVALAGNNANSDFIYAWDSACVSPLAPETAVEFFWHDKLKGASDVNAERTKLAGVYAKENASAWLAAEKDCIDEVIAPADTKKVISSALDILAGKRVSTLPKKHNNIPF